MIKIKKDAGLDLLTKTLNNFNQKISKEMLRNVGEELVKRLKDQKYSFESHPLNDKEVVILSKESPVKLGQLKDKMVVVAFNKAPLPGNVFEAIKNKYWTFMTLPVFPKFEYSELIFIDVRPDELEKINAQRMAELLWVEGIFKQFKIPVKFGYNERVSNVIVWEDAAFNFFRREYGFGIEYMPQLEKIIQEINFEYVIDELFDNS